MNKTWIVLLAGLLIASMAGCGTGGDTPETVAGAFWTALQNDDLATARTYATPETADMLNERENTDEEVEVTLGETTMEDGEAHVETTMKAAREGQAMEIPMTTILVQNEGTWKVDVNKTMMSVFGGAMGVMMEEMGTAMGDAMQETGTSMAEGMQESMETMETTEAMTATEATTETTTGETPDTDRP